MMKIDTYLSFVVGNMHFAIDVAHVLEVVQNYEVTHIPNAPDYVKGIINFRGQVVPVYESRTKFRVTERDAGDSFVVIVLDLEMGQEFVRVGIVVDRVSDVIMINNQKIQPMPNYNQNINNQYFEGVYKTDEAFMLILDIAKVFVAEEVKQFAEKELIE